MSEKTVNLTPEAQQLIAQMQTFQAQYQTIAVQKESIALQGVETDKALEELKKIKEREEVFKIVGPVLVKSTKAEMLKELSEKKEMAEVRMKSIDKQEEKLREKLQETQKKLEEIFKGLEVSEAGGAG